MSRAGRHNEELHPPRWSFLWLALALVLGESGLQAAFAQEPNVKEAFEQAAALARAGKLAEAEAPLNRLLAETNDAAIPRVLMFRAFLRADNGRLQEAATDLKRVLEIDPSDHMPWFQLAPLLVQIGETNEYRNHCEAMLRRFSGTTSASVAERTAKCCLLTPSALSPAGLALAARVAKNAVALGKRGEIMPWRLMTQGLAEYRQGHFARALKMLELAQTQTTQTQDPTRDMCRTETYFIAAMAHYKLKQPDEARTAWKHGHVFVQAKLPSLDGSNLGPGWVDVLMTYILMAEAKMTLESTLATTSR